MLMESLRKKEWNLNLMVKIINFHLCNLIN
jgi:hypothetical protein